MIALSHLRRLDGWVGWPTASLLGLWPRRRRKLPPSPGQILVVKFFGIGSLLTCAGVFRALREAQPQARIVVVTLAGNAPALRLIPAVDEVLAVSDTGGFGWIPGAARVLRELRRRQVDVAVDIEYFSKLSTVFCALSGARYRLGFRLEARWRRRLIDGGAVFSDDCHFRVCVARLLAPLGVDERKIPAEIAPVPPEAVQAAQGLLAEAAAGASPAPVAWVVVNPHAAALCVQRRWPLERFAQVMESLLARHAGLWVAIPGTAGERARSEQLRDRISPALRARVCVLAGRTDLPALAAVLRQSRLVLTNDTGILHVAAAVGAPLVALFGPESPVRYGPMVVPTSGTDGASKVRVLTGAVPCGPCLCQQNRKRAPCAVEPALCMLAIPAEDVLRACEEILEQNPCPP